MIAEGRVARDGAVIDTPATVLASLRGVTVDGEPVAAPAPARLFLHHKPAGLLVTERDPRGRPTIYDRLPSDLPRVVPVGRLDLNTEGLLLLTTDGGLKRQLELPATGVERAYRARCYGQVSQAQLETLMEGIEIDRVRYGPINANLERRTGANTWVEMILTEGKNREVRRVLEHLGLQVGRLIRTRYGPFVLGDLPPGTVGEVRQADLVAFRQTLGKRGSEERIAVQAAQTATSRVPRSRSAPSQLLPGERMGPVTMAPEKRERSPVKVYPLAPTGARAPHSAPLRPPGARPTPPKLHPGEGRGPVTVTAERRERPALKANSQSGGEAGRRTRQQDGSSVDPGLRRGGARTPTAPSRSPGPRSGSQATGPVATDEVFATPRPAKPPLRKAGWAKPKPKTGPKRPGKR